MTDPILLLLTRLRDLYAMHMAQLDSLPRRTGFDPHAHARDCLTAIVELDVQIARCVEEQEDRPPLFDDIFEGKRYADQHKT